MTTRYVHAQRGSATGTFDSIKAPARKIADAVKVAKAGDAIVILDTATYREGELVIDKSLTIVSSALLANPKADPTSAGFDPKSLPELTPARGQRSRVMRVVGTPKTQGSVGPVAIRGLRFTGGRAVQDPRDPALGAGGGLAVVDIHTVTVDRCIFSGNRTHQIPTPRLPDADRIALRKAVMELAGTILSHVTVGFINVMINGANIMLKAAGLQAFPILERAKILKKLCEAFDRKVHRNSPNYWVAGQAFGGGAAAVWASPHFSHCLFRNNRADGRGAGFAVVGYGWPLLESCWIDRNRSGGQGRRDGGGLGCEIGLPGKMTRNLSEVDLIKFLTAKLEPVKKKLGNPLSEISIFEILQYGAYLTNPYAPTAAKRGLKAVLLDVIHLRFEKAMENLLYYFVATALSLERWSAWNQAEIIYAQRMSVRVHDCRITGNICVDDGGGVYASVLSRTQFRNTRIENNLAGGGGGGLRFSMGSDSALTGCDVTGNIALVRDPKGKTVSGGGGISARNADVVLTNTRVGRATGGIGRHSNLCSDHAGGGIAVKADTEGRMASIPNLWTAIMVEVFGKRKLKVSVSADCLIAGNGAGYTQRRRAMGRTRKAKGGGLWLLQGAFPDAPRATLTVDNARQVIRNNVGRTRKYESKVRPGTRIAHANQVCLQDMIGKKEWTEANYRPLLKGRQLRFEPR